MSSAYLLRRPSVNDRFGGFGLQCGNSSTTAASSMWHDKLMPSSLTRPLMCTCPGASCGRFSARWKLSMFPAPKR